MASKTTAKKTEPARGYEFGGPIGAAGIVFGLPTLLYVFTFLCNDISGCPAPGLLSPKTLTLENLKYEVGWPADGIWGLGSWKATGWTLAYYLLNMTLYRVLPAKEVDGTELVSGGKLKYRMNALATSAFVLVACAAGTIAQGAEFPVWTFISDNYLQILTANNIISYALAIYVYIASFSVKPGNAEKRELAAGGHTGNLIYDFYIGRELNPRCTLPFFGEIDVKTFCELRPGLLGWILLNCAFVAKQYRNFGFVTDSIVFITIVQALYVLDSFVMEPSVLTMMDITTDGFGFMLCFGDLAWLPFMYSTQTRYLAVHPVSMGRLGTAGVLVVLLSGFTIFRLSNMQKDKFRTNPDDPSVANLSYIETKKGTRLITSGWWGVARHINYLGDWIQAWPYSLPTGISGYTILTAGSVVPGAFKMADGREVVQGPAYGWGILFTYFYILYFGVLLVHRDGRDDEKCYRKYGDDWLEYKKMVKYRIVPGIY
ncbi:delta(14)-sterol reductase like protein [Xylariales sp. AK1849]|nr:delta(14)-sterol reductase like protein [Xylariales sp. AK1849]